MLFMTILGDIGLAIVKALRTLFMSLCDVVYRLIVVFYNIFEEIGTATLLSNDTVMGMYRKVGLILGLFMVFRVSFSIINYIINPDLMGDKQKGMGNIVKRIIIVVVLLGITPSLFREAYALQNTLIKENIVGKILFEDNNSINSSNGQNLAWFGFSSFYYLNKDEWTTGRSLEDKGNIKKGAAISENSLYYLCPEMDDRDENPTLVETTFKKGGTFKFAYNCLNETLEVERGGVEERLWVINFDGSGLICTVVGVLLLWMILMYTLQLGVRLLQLAYLQLIAPIPIIMYLEPKSEALTKWAKQCTTTFLDFFIRTGIMYFAIFIINLLINNDTSFLDSFDGAAKLYVKIMMIIAILIFAKRVPKLLEEIIPMLKNAASLDFGLKIPKEVKQVGGTVAGATAAGAIGLIGGKGLGRVSGLLSGAVKGGVSGAKGTKLKDIASARAKQNITNRQNREQGNTFGVRMGTKMRETFGFDTEGYSEIAKLQYQWDDGRNTAKALIDKKIKNSKGETKLDDTVSYSDFAKLGFNEEWVSAFKQKSIAKKKLEEATKELTLAQASVSAASTPDEKRDAELRYKSAYEEYDKFKAASETADKVKAAMDKKHSGDAQRFDNYKYYSKNDKSRPGNIYAESNVPKSSSTQGSTPESNSQPEQTSIPDSDEHAGEQQTTSTNINQSILDDDNFDKGFAGTSEYLKEDTRKEKNSYVNNDSSSNSSVLGRIFGKKEDEDLSAQAEFIREKAAQQKQNEELEKARQALKDGAINPDTIDNAANERSKAGMEKLNNDESNNN